jgi:hypothetical protein
MRARGGNCETGTLGSLHKLVTDAKDLVTQL